MMALGLLVLYFTMSAPTGMQPVALVITLLIFGVSFYETFAS